MILTYYSVPLTSPSSSSSSTSPSQSQRHSVTLSLDLTSPSLSHSLSFSTSSRPSDPHCGVAFLNGTEAEPRPPAPLTSLISLSTSSSRFQCTVHRFSPKSELRNDHKEITEKLNRNIEVLHSARLTPKQSSLKDSDGQSASVVNVVASASSTNVHTGSTNAMDVDVIVSVPFALVGEISDASPAAEDGLQLGDQIVKFDSVENGDNLLQKLASEAQANQGRGIPVILVRQGAQVNFTMTPRTWQGRGLLRALVNISY
ncbi:26S proteasome non-ATPase regulatory subunit 9 [Pyrus x bretschneideri]|uniref:26S proteasome non-ATPase regulatory subunit 9 n=1 Tax=Pyrus x bretschneideri TaxID=225117 RepID=UPI00202F8ABE|nr:26S proteasome non-ATPase regulatory subunit 9 [Pyrus x bretschneideri]